MSNEQMYELETRITVCNLDEPILPDDYPVYAGYLYVADGKVIEAPGCCLTVLHLKQLLQVAEIRRCDIVGRQEIYKRIEK